MRSVSVRLRARHELDWTEFDIRRRIRATQRHMCCLAVNGYRKRLYYVSSSGAKRSDNFRGDGSDCPLLFFRAMGVTEHKCP